MTFDQLLGALHAQLGKRVDASVFHYHDGEPVLLLTMSGKLRAVRPVDPDAEGTEEEVVHLALTAADRHDSAAFLIERAMFRGDSVDKDGVSVLLGEVELHVSPAPR